jgi:hypothetical protein
MERVIHNVTNMTRLMQEFVNNLNEHKREADPQVMATFELMIHDSHPIIVSGNHRILVDTGSPLTIHDSEGLTFMDRRYEVGGALPFGPDIGELSRMIGTPLTTLMGMDILREYRVLFSYSRQLMGFSREPIEQVGHKQQMDTFMGIPVMEVECMGALRRMFLDTGAKLSYLAAGLCADIVSEGWATDFYPGHGSFRTETYRIRTKVGDSEFEALYGNLPDGLQMLLDLGSAEGILGSDLFFRHDILLDMANKDITIRRVEQTWI